MRSGAVRAIVTMVCAALATLAVARGSAVATPLPPPPPIPTPITSGVDARGYQGPVGAPGSVIAARPLDPRVTLAGAGRASRILYATIDQHGAPAVSSGAVFYPRGAAPPGGWPVLAWAHGTVGLGDDCAPSTQPRVPEDSAYLSHWLGRGFAVVATDYVGLGTPGAHPYLDGAAAARSITDSVVAAHRLNVPLSPRWFAVGHSQGAAAALNTAARRQTLLAGRGYDFRGVVATGAPANIESLVQFGGPTFPPVVLPRGINGYLLYILSAFREARPDLHIDRLLTPLGRRLAAVAGGACGKQLRPYGEGLDLRRLFTRPLSSVPDVYQALRDYLGTPDRGYTRPILIGQGLADTNVPAPSALSLAAQLSANRQPLELRVYPAADHPGVLSAVLPDADRFVDRIMR